MSFVGFGENTDRKDIVCPFLGLQDDTTTAYQFASYAHQCFHARPISAVMLEAQRKYCLTINHANCEEFIRTPNTALPASLRFENGSKLLEETSKRWVWIFLLVLALLTGIAWLIRSRVPFSSRNPAQAPIVVMATGLKDTATQTLITKPTQVQPTTTPNTVVAVTPTQELKTIIPAVRPPHYLETPIGLEQKLIIHRVLVGESLPSIANLYRTTTEAIQSVNYSLPLPLLIDWLVVVPTDPMDVKGLPAFNAYIVTAEVSVTTLAQQLSINPELLELYNGLKGEDLLNTGEWVLVPYLGTPTP